MLDVGLLRVAPQRLSRRVRHVPFDSLRGLPFAMDSEDAPGFFDGFEYFLEAIQTASDSQYQTALHTLIRGVNAAIAADSPVDGRRLLLCLQALLCMADITLAEDVPGWTEFDLEAGK